MPVIQAFGRLIEWWWSTPSRPSPRAPLLPSVEPIHPATATATPQKIPKKTSAGVSPPDSSPHDPSPPGSPQGPEQKDEKDNKDTLPKHQIEVPKEDDTPSGLMISAGTTVEKGSIEGAGADVDLPESEKFSSKPDDVQEGEKGAKVKKRKSKSSSSSSKKNKTNKCRDDANFFDLDSIGTGDQAPEPPYRNIVEVVFVDENTVLNEAIAKQIDGASGKSAGDRTPSSSASISVELAPRDLEEDGEAANADAPPSADSELAVRRVDGAEAATDVVDVEAINSEAIIVNPVVAEQIHPIFADGHAIFADDSRLVSKASEEEETTEEVEKATEEVAKEVAKKEARPNDEPSMEVFPKAAEHLAVNHKERVPTVLLVDTKTQEQREKIIREKRRLRALKEGGNQCIRTTRDWVFGQGFIGPKPAGWSPPSRWHRFVDEARDDEDGNQKAEKAKTEGNGVKKTEEEEEETKEEAKDVAKDVAKEVADEEPKEEAKEEAKEIAKKEGQPTDEMEVIPKAAEVQRLAAEEEVLGAVQTDLLDPVAEQGKGGELKKGELKKGELKKGVVAMDDKETVADEGGPAYPHPTSDHVSLMSASVQDPVERSFAPLPVEQVQPATAQEHSDAIAATVGTAHISENRKATISFAPIIPSTPKTTSSAQVYITAPAVMSPPSFSGLRGAFSAKPNVNAQFSAATRGPNPHATKKVSPSPGPAGGTSSRARIRG